jgi:HSP20 family molecular chaperone IbpA
MIDQQRIDAAFTDGVLTLNLHKVQKATPRRIEIG